MPGEVESGLTEEGAAVLGRLAALSVVSRCCALSGPGVGCCAFSGTATESFRGHGLLCYALPGTEMASAAWRCAVWCGSWCRLCCTAMHCS
eukprot:1995077-Rhodomonas_salina.1